MTTSKYLRSPEQNESLGLAAENPEVIESNKQEGNYEALLDRPFGAAAVQENKTAPYPLHETDKSVNLGRDEVVEIPDMCPNCAKMGKFKSAMTSIPHFKEVLIMAFNCVFCGYRSNEVKGGGAIPAKGQRIELTITGPSDLKRDILKGDSAALKLPSMDLELSHGSLGGVYTTIEGLLNKIYTNLRDNNPFAIGDSVLLHHSDEESTNKKDFVLYLEKLKLLSSGNEESFPFTILLHDPLGNSFISAPLGSFLPPEADKNLDISDYDRTQEEDDEFGISDMSTRDFETLGDSGLNPDDYYDPNKILSDKLTHVLPKSIDHPQSFAQGVADNTAGGKVFASFEASESHAPEGYSAGNVAYGGIDDFPEILKLDKVAADASGLDWESTILNEKYSQRHFFDDSSLADQGFEAREEFAGRREGFVYRLGSLGLGYYPDVRKMGA